MSVLLLITVVMVGCSNKSIEQAKLATAALKKVQSRISVGIINPAKE
jgi:hypothetical protein